MRLLYPLCVSFGECRKSAESVVRLKCFGLEAIRPEDLAADDNTDAPATSRLFVSDQQVEMPWPHHFYVLVNQQNLQQNLQRLHWLTQQALLGFQLRRPRKSSSSSLPPDNNAAMISYDYELALYDVDTSLTSLYDTCSMFDSWQWIDELAGQHDTRVSHNPRKRLKTSAASTTTPPPSSLTLVRGNNLYRVRLRSNAQYRHLFEYFRDNAHYWQHQFSVPVNLLYDQFRYALDVYVSNLRFKIARDTLTRSGMMDARMTDAAGSSVAQSGGSSLYRKLLQRLQRGDRPAEQLKRDPLDMRRWFACGQWCLFDQKRLCVSVVPADEFVGCARTLLALPDHVAPDHLLRRLYDTPLDFVPRLVWDIETVARGKGTIPRGITADQKLSSVALVIERPALEVGRLVLVYVLAPDDDDDSSLPSIDQLDLGLSDDERLNVRHCRVFAYRDERAMLLDFLLDMTCNVSLLRRFFGIRGAAVPRYHHLCTLLTGYNSIEYDYAFLLERCVFFDSREFAPLLLTMRRFSAMSRPLCSSWVFNEAQLCLDAMQFLQARNRQLKSYKLANVLRVYGCDIEKIEFSAVEIRRLYFPEQHADHLPPPPPLRDVLRYNAFDCLSLCALLDRCSFAYHMTVMMRYFFAPLDVVMYKGNSSLLPTLVQLDNMREKREMAVFRQPTCNNLLCSSARVEDSVLLENQRILLERYRRSLRLERFPSSRAILASDNPFTAVLNYHRVLRMFNNDDDYDNDGSRGSDNAMSPIDPHQLYHGRLALTAHNEMEQLRVGEKTYIGGMNDADPSHSKYPVLADYNSFYPSIIRSYTLDVCKVAVLDLKQLLLTVPIPLLELLLDTKILRLFDYTCLDDLAHNVDLAAHRRLCDGQEWHEAVEYTSFEQILCTSKQLARRFLALVYTPDPSTVDGIATNALKRRAEWKAKRKLNPKDVVLEFMEMMEKLLANSLYGYMNFGQSAIFSRATAAAVTLLCRNAFCRTRRIIESADLVATTLLDPELYRFKVIYIDTDGCIFVLTRLDDAVPAEMNRRDRPATEPWYRLYADLEPSDTVAVHDRLIAEVNRRLNLKHVTLAAEHYNAFAVCVFAKKKYALLLGPHGDVKKTGFESNAAKPIRHVYDLLLRNTLRAFHIYRLVQQPRFLVTIRHHRLFFYAIFDYMYELWRSRDSAYTRLDFCQVRPLNPKDNQGEMSRFIDRVLYEFRYTAGERVAMLRIVDPTTAVQDDVLYPQRGRFVMLEELDQEQDIVPNLQFFLGCYTRYFYQCVEGQQTLREGTRVTREPIEPGFYLTSFKSILEYSWACWLYCRVLRSRYPRLRGVYWPKTERSQQRLPTTINREGQQPVVLPAFLPQSFFADKDCLPNDNPFYTNLFAATRDYDEQADLAAKRRFLETDRYICITPLSNK